MTIRYCSDKNRFRPYCICEDQISADQRIMELIKKDERHIEVILIPLLEEVNLERYFETGKVDKVTCGGDCGPSGRICDYNWILKIREQCVKNQVEFVFIQTGSNLIKDGRIYHISADKQKSQAVKAGIDFVPDFYNKTEEIFKRLSKSKFRSGFSLKQKERDYLEEKGIDVIERHAYEMIEKRLAPSDIDNDGRQTPMRGHPVFIAQHATATCCRGCLEKWHHIPAGRELSAAEKKYVVYVIMEWIIRQTT